MKKIRVVGKAAGFAIGCIVTLTIDQAKTRIHNLERIGKTKKYKVLSPIQFKCGEELGFDGEIDKSSMEDLDIVDEKLKDLAKMTKLQLIDEAVKAGKLITDAETKTKAEIIKLIENDEPPSATVVGRDLTEMSRDELIAKAVDAGLPEEEVDLLITDEIIKLLEEE